MLHFQFELGDHFARPLVADGAVFAGVGQYFGAVGGDGELAELEQFELLGQLQDFDEALSLVPPPIVTGITRASII